MPIIPTFEATTRVSLAARLLRWFPNTINGYDGASVPVYNK